MQIKINVLTKVIDSKKTTFYFIYNKSKIILPIEISSIRDKSIEDTYIRTLKALDVNIESIHIYLFLENVFYVYLRIKFKNRHMDINTSIHNALYILENIPKTEVFIENEILINEGIRITKEIIERSLEN